MDRTWWLTVFLAGANALAAPAALQRYVLEHYPGTGTACREAAERVAKRLQDAGFIGTYHAGASTSAGPEAGCNLTVTYPADRPLPVVSSAVAWSSFQGMYPSREACEAALGVEERVFGEATGLPPVVSYCYRDTGGSDHPYTARVDGIGEPKKAPAMMHEILYFGPRLEAAAAVTAEIFKSAAERKIPVARVAFTAASGRDGKELFIRHYAANYRTIVDWHELGYLSESTCEARLAEVREIFTAAGAKPLAVFCTPPFLSNWKLRHVHVLYVRTDAVTFKKVEGEYDSLERCAAEREAIAALYPTDSDERAKGAICTESENGRASLVLVLHSPYRQVREP